MGALIASEIQNQSTADSSKVGASPLKASSSPAASPAVGLASLKPRYVGHTINLCSQKTT